jgi:hypothetical protein
LVDSVYPDDRKPAQSTIKAHVWQVNDMLEKTDFRIASIGKRWVLTRVSR